MSLKNQKTQKEREATLKEKVEADKIRRGEACQKELGALLEKYQCEIIPKITIFGDRIVPELILNTK